MHRILVLLGLLFFTPAALAVDAGVPCSGTTGCSVLLQTRSSGGVLQNVLKADSGSAVTLNRTSASVLSGVTNRNTQLILKNTDSVNTANNASSIDFVTNLGVTAASIITQYQQSGGGGDGGNLIFATDPAAGGLRQVGSVDNSGIWTLGATGSQVTHFVNGSLKVQGLSGVSTGAAESIVATSNLNIGTYYGILTFNPRASTQAAGDFMMRFVDNTGIRGSISAASTTTTVFTTTSDRRLKKNIKDYVGGLKALAALRVRDYDWRQDGHHDVGFIAQELKPIWPGAVIGDETGDPIVSPMQVDYGKVTPLLAAALKEEVAKVAALEARLSKLEARMEAAGL